MVADEVVINNEHLLVPTHAVQHIELTQDLLRRFGAGPATVNSDDVAKFTLERASAGKLDGHRNILVPLQQIEPRHGALGHVWLVDNVVQRVCGALFECGGDSRKYLVGSPTIT